MLVLYLSSATLPNIVGCHIESIFSSCHTAVKKWILFVVKKKYRPDFVMAFLFFIQFMWHSFVNLIFFPILDDYWMWGWILHHLKLCLWTSIMIFISVKIFWNNVDLCIYFMFPWLNIWFFKQWVISFWTCAIKSLELVFIFHLIILQLKINNKQWKQNHLA